jgi:hypothetical protein
LSLWFDKIKFDRKGLIYFFFNMPTDTLNTKNPEQLIYNNDLLQLCVLGGIKLEGLDRMRVTLKVELVGSSRPPVRHNLDLYNDNQLEKFIRKVAEKLEVGTSVIAASLSELTEELEKYRLVRIEEQRPDEPQRPVLSELEMKAAHAFLSEPDLMQRTGDMIGKSGMIGEENNRLLMYLIFTSRKRSQPLHVVSLGASGIGKTHLQEKIGELIPEEDKIEITTLSENAFYYFGQRELKNKLILIEDLDGAENVLYPLRELQSKKRISKTIANKNSKGETRTIHLVVEGPVCVAGCTTQEQIYEDNANRSFLIYLDESGPQTDLILDYQRKLSAGKIDKDAESEAVTLLKNTQRLLKPVKVVNPYAELLSIPQEVLKPRRTNNHYLQFIEAVSYYHQYQREQKADEQTGEIYIETTLEDIAQANQLLKEVLLRKSDELTGACRNYFEKLKLYLLGQEEKVFSNREMSGKLRVPVTTIKRYHLDLYNSGFLRITKKDKFRGYEYEIVSYEQYKRLQEDIGKVLDLSLKNLQQSKQPSSPVMAHLEDEPPKAQVIRKKTPVAQEMAKKDKRV